MKAPALMPGPLNRETKMKILTFDIAIKTGWCFGEIGSHLVGGTQRHAPSGADHGFVFRKAMVWVADQINLYRPDRVAYEFNRNTIAGKQKSRSTNIDTILVHGGLRAIILAVTGAMDVQCREANAQEASSAFLGLHKQKKIEGEDSKEPVKRECRIRGLEFVDDNHSDAIALWHHQAFRLDPEFAARDAVARMRMRDPALLGGVA